MIKGDLFFKAVDSVYDNWRTVLKYEVVHYTNKSKVLAVVKKNSTNYKDTEHTVSIGNVRCQVPSLAEALDYIVDYYDD